MAVNTTTVEVTMPQMGDSVSEGTVLEWHKQEGDEVSEDETLVEISTDKVDAEVPAPAAGTVTKIHADETIVEISTDKVDAEVPAPASGTMGEILADAGETVSVGQVLARMAAGDGAPPKAPAPTSAPRPQGTAPARMPEGV